MFVLVDIFISLYFKFLVYYQWYYTVNSPDKNNRRKSIRRSPFVYLTFRRINYVSFNKSFSSEKSCIMQMLCILLYWIQWTDRAEVLSEGSAKIELQSPCGSAFLILRWNRVIQKKTWLVQPVRWNSIFDTAIYSV